MEIRTREPGPNLMTILTALEELDLKDWATIKSIARELYNAKQYEEDQVKCYIAAFLIWCAQNDFEIKILDHEFDPSTVH
jgi:hypothetical protein